MHPAREALDLHKIMVAELEHEFRQIPPVLFVLENYHAQLLGMTDAYTESLQRLRLERAAPDTDAGRQAEEARELMIATIQAQLLKLSDKIDQRLAVNGLNASDFDRIRYLRQALPEAQKLLTKLTLALARAEEDLQMAEAARRENHAVVHHLGPKGYVETTNVPSLSHRLTHK